MPIIQLSYFGNVTAVVVVYMEAQWWTKRVKLSSGVCKWISGGSGCNFFPPDFIGKATYNIIVQKLGYSLCIMLILLHIGCTAELNVVDVSMYFH